MRNEGDTIKRIAKIKEEVRFYKDIISKTKVKLRYFENKLKEEEEKIKVK